jgi:hypothetical protein
MWVLTSDEQERKEVDMYIGSGLLLLILIIVLLVILF